jgi:flagellar protein FliS
MNQRFQAYNRASNTVAKTRQVVMLYDGAIRFLQQGVEAMERKEIETRYHKLTKVTDVITGLQASLDFNSGAEAARILYDFYSSIGLRIHALHRSNDVEAGKKIIAEMKNMREFWNKVDQGETDGKPTSSATSQASSSDDTVTVSA